MKSITPITRRKNIRRSLANIFSIALIVLSITALTFEAFAVGSHDEGTTGDTDDGSGGRPCTTGNCFSPRKNGAFWVEVDTSGGGSFQSIFGSGGHSTYVTRPANFSNCPTTAYVLVSRLGNGGLAGPIDINNVSTGSGNPGEGGAATKITDGDGGWIPAGASFRTNAEAEAKFSENQDFYNAPPYNQQYYGTHMGWFCADPQGTPPPSTTPKIKIYESCKADRTRQKGDTKTRIAVRNITLDSVIDINTNWNPRSGKRKPLLHDTGWTDGGGSAETLAKPGDSIQFLHAYCAGARFVRRTEHQGVHWTQAETHNKLLDIPTNHFKIYADYDYFLFGDGISWVNSEAASSSEYGAPDGPYPFNTAPPDIPGLWRTNDKFGVGTASPTFNNTSYDCNGVSMYAAWGVPFKGGGSFQIPGFISGWSCNSASKTRSDLVGSTIVQKHDFNLVRAWEKNSHSKSNDCTCGSGGARLNYNNFADEYGDAGKGGNWGERHTWECEPVCVLCCDWQCDDGYDPYTHECLGGSNHKDNYPHKSTNFELSYQSKTEDKGKQTKTATVYIPYNFLTSVNAYLNAGDTIFQGGSIKSSFSWSVDPRDNDKTSTFPYATYTPGYTQVKFIEFILEPYAENFSGNTNSPVEPCTHYKGGEGDDYLCKEIETIGGSQNPAGYYQGDGSGTGYTRTVPDNDEYIGFKYCVAMGFYPSDSHGFQGNELGVQKGIAMHGGNSWNISKASCRTIAKKPNMQVWNGSLYTEGNVTTSISKKDTNALLGKDYSGDDTKLFGSWADYSVSAMGVVRGMASGAITGFDNGGYNLSGGGRDTSGMNMKRLSPLTLANSGDEVGKSNVNASASIDINLNRLKARYSDKALAYAKKNGGSNNMIRTAETGMQFVYYDGDISLSSLQIAPNNGNPNQTTYKDGKGIYKKLATNDTADNTLVLYVKGKLTIDGNICLGEGCGDTGGMRLIDYAKGTSTNSTAKLPQILIFADNIAIEQEVTRIDAWLIAPKGNINTCTGYSIGSTLEAHDARGRYGAGSCYKTLMVNGPVYAKSLTLNRTAGATHGVAPSSPGVLTKQYGAIGQSSDADLGSQTPAEIFNLRADAYLWAYEQAGRYSEAVVTYMRELAPRY